MKIYNKLFALLLIWICLFCGVAQAETMNWCGVYFENNNQGYIKLLRSDVGIGSDSCNKMEYFERKDKERVINVWLDFSRGKITYSKWHKFNGHLIEVKGKYRGGVISGTKFVRDLGV